MGSVTKLSYQRLKHESGVDEEDPEEEKAFRRMRNWSKKTGKLPAKRQRPRVRIAGLKRLFRRRREKVFSALRGTWNKAVRRLRESQVHMNDLFAGNYLFTQVSPSAIKKLDKTFMSHDLHGFTSRCSCPKFA